MRLVIALAAVCAAASVAAAEPHLIRDGANHHLGDDSFIEAFKRAPTATDSEAVRMHVHLAYVRDLLGKHAATSPGLEGRRAELLHYLDDYIAKGTTPDNTYVPYRNPVFIDATGKICAVGYLIERSVGRALPEQIAATHRLDYLEDIAAAVPDVRDWVAASGFTLDELASIQPGYPGPEVQHLMGWIKESKELEWQSPSGTVMPADGPYTTTTGDLTMSGRFTKQQMVGEWTNKHGSKVLGKGTFTAGAGTWTSFREDGTKLAQGPFVNSHANGEWKIFHPSGRLAAIGQMTNGRRNGTWTFYYDVKGSPVLSRGPFKKGQTEGGWRHFAQDGKLVATASGGAWGGLTLSIEPNKDGVRHEVHQGYPASSERMDGFYLGKDRLYVEDDKTMYDGNGNEVSNTDGVWMQAPCNWPRARKAAAARGDASTLHDSMYAYRYRGTPAPKPMVCDDSKATKVAPATVKHYETMLASRAQIHAPIPTFDVDPAPPAPATTEDPEVPNSAFESVVAGKDNDDDFATYLTDGIRWYIEWPHVDGTFMTVYRSLPGY